MELMSWAMHKYLFHGPLWFIHKTHHQQRHGWFELNDLFSIGFAALALWLMWAGHITLDYRFWIGTGISIYGTIYFIFHDWFIHNRLRHLKAITAICRASVGHIKSTINQQRKILRKSLGYWWWGGSGLRGRMLTFLFYCCYSIKHIIYFIK
jgi:beta-carotene 3-hydroxylase